MAKKSGILIGLITKFGGISKQSITNLGGIATSTIPGWPSACVIRTFGYADLFSDPPTACEFFYQQPINYLYDGTLNVLYGAGEPCGGAYALDGYYSDGVNIYVWNTAGGTTLFNQIGICR